MTDDEKRELYTIICAAALVTCEWIEDWDDAADQGAKFADHVLRAIKRRAAKEKDKK